MSSLWGRRGGEELGWVLLAQWCLLLVQSSEVGDRKSVV